MKEKEKRRRHGSSSSKRKKKEYDTSSSSYETTSQTDHSSSSSSDSSQDEEEAGHHHRHRSKRRGREKASNRKRDYASSSDSPYESGSSDQYSSSFDTEQDSEDKLGHHRRHRSKTRKEEKRSRHGSKKRKRDKDVLAKKVKGKDRGHKKNQKRRKHRGLKKHQEPTVLDTVVEVGLDPIQVVSNILNDFPGIAPDLSKLLERIDEGQAIDLSGLPNKPLAAALERLFQSLNLHESKKGLYLVLPEDHQRRSDILGPILKKPSSEMEDGSSHHNPSKADLVPEQNPDIDITIETTQHEPKKRVLGPAMPTAEMLEAAARLTEAEALLREAEQELELEPLIGPVPPALVIESENANEAERFEEVTRILSPDNQNAYELLGLGRGVSGEALKKRYWKLSLMVHPDKCKHPLAQEAFTALNQALKDLQDSNKRALIDRKIEEKEAKEEYEAEVKAKRDAAIWRKIRGEPLPGDELLLDDGPKAKTRDEWMTTLPPERKAGPPSMQSTFFSKSEKSGRGDTSVWTDTPLDKALKAKTEYLEAYSKATLTAAEDKVSNPMTVPSRMAKMMDEFDGARRSVSLLEKHEKQKQKQKKQKQEAHVSYKPRKEIKRQEKEDWQDKHPWKPWDRERDLAAGRQNVKLDAANMSAGLSSRFASSQTERSFL